MNIKFNKISRGVALACGISMAYMPSATVSAQQQAAEDDIEIIQVRATKRAENAKDIPMAINVTTGEAIEKQSITHLEDLSATIPNFIVGDSLTTNNVYMRGMGSGADRGFEQSVSMYVNGVYMPRSRQTRASFFDVGHIEVLRGAQSVLFGLNSTAGAVSIHNNVTNPGDDFHASVLAEYETEYEGTKADVIVGGSLTDTFAVRVALREADSDGWMKNVVTDVPTLLATGELSQQDSYVGGRDESVQRITAVFEPSSSFKVTAGYETGEFTVDGSMGEIFNIKPTGEAFGYPLYDDGTLNWQQSSDTSLINDASGMTINFNVNGGETYQESDNAFVQTSYTFGNGYELQANLGYSDFEYSAAVDVDTTSLPLWDAYNFETYEQTSGELVFLSPTDGRFSYIVGAYYQTSDFYTAQPNIVDLNWFGSAIVERGDNPLTVEQTMMSVYFSADYDITDNLTVIAGARWTDDEKDYDRQAYCQWDMGAGFMNTADIFGSPVNPGGAFVCSPAGYDGNSDTIDSDNVMPEVTIKYQINDDSSIYAKAGESVKSGGIATAGSIAPESLVFDDETVFALEAGYKLSFMDDAGSFGITVFQSEFDDLQVKTSVLNDMGAPVSIASNVGEATTAGVEMDVNMILTDWLTIGANVAYLDAEYDSFRNGPCNYNANLPEDPNGQGGCDLSGETMPYAPEVSGSVFADLNFDLTSNLVLQGGVVVAYSDEYYTDGALNEDLVQGSYTKVNARLGIASSEGTWEVNVIGNNLTEEEILTGVQEFGGFADLGYLAAPRTVTIQGVIRFGG
ncbi:TonB-dependent receptor [Thalassotalea sp. Y01]|uniref:TonB-dependent receptor n=1 Tax=Thalassotalea sp. Y01 TaxID=2729613 RepID=UPI00145CDF31|nr:TonB-dependent receptor [Thalassotalea sp. Y01]NMP14725.1 TonB-dependent receptor [Thalassotalea sp. Y01]